MKKILFLLPLLILAGCNNANKTETTNEIKIGLYDNLELCTTEKCESKHYDFAATEFIGRVVYNSISLVEDDKNFTIKYEVVKIERNEQTGILYYAEPTEKEKEELCANEPITRVEEETFSKSGNYYQYSKRKEFSVEDNDEETQWESKYWEKMDNCYELAFQTFDTYFENLGVQELIRMAKYKEMYSKVKAGYEEITKYSYDPQAKPNWNSYSPAEYRRVLSSFYSLYVIPFARTITNTDEADGYEGYNEDWDVNNIEGQNVIDGGRLEKYQTNLYEVIKMRIKARESCELPSEDTEIALCSYNSIQKGETLSYKLVSLKVVQKTEVTGMNLLPVSHMPYFKAKVYIYSGTIITRDLVAGLDEDID